MKILYLNPPFLRRFSRAQRSPAVTKSGTLYYPLWLAYAAGVAESAGHEVKLIDSCAEMRSPEETLAQIKDFSPELVIEDTSTPSIYSDIAFASRIKKILPQTTVVLVGPHVSALPEETLASGPDVDAVCRGEFDFTALDIAASIGRGNRDFTALAGVSSRMDGRIFHGPERELLRDMDTLPFVSRVYKKHLNIRNYFFAASVYPEVQITTARGCPYRCFFCTWPQAYHGRVWRPRSPRNVVDELEYIQHELPVVKGVVLEDDTFTVDTKRVAHICELIIQRSVKVAWNANVRTDLDLTTMKSMKRAGCYLLIAGIESGSQLILDNIAKDERVEDIQRFFDNAKAAGLLVHAAFMAGNPGETLQTLRENLRLAKRLLPDTVQFFPLTPYPGTAAYAWAKEKGFLKAGSYRDYLTDTGGHACVIDAPGLPAGELMRWCDASRQSFYLNPRYLLYKAWQLVWKPRDAIRTYKTFRTFRKHLLGQT